MISKIYNSNRILFAAGSRRGKLKEEIELEVELQKDSPDKEYLRELRRIISWKKPKRKRLTKAQRRERWNKKYGKCK